MREAMPAGTAAAIRSSRESKPTTLEHPGDVVRAGSQVAVGEDGLLAHGWLLDWIVRFASPSVVPALCADAPELPDPHGPGA